VSKLFDYHWQWSNDGVMDTTAVGRVVRTCVQQLVKKGYDRAEVLFMIQMEAADELLKVADEKKDALFVVPEIDEEKKDVHTEHCCIYHGCKYMDSSCPVYLGYKAQSYPCESCSFHWSFDDKEVVSPVDVPKVTKEEIAKRRLEWTEALDKKELK